jgi:hypothetical protein
VTRDPLGADADDINDMVGFAPFGVSSCFAERRPRTMRTTLADDSATGRIDGSGRQRYEKQGPCLPSKLKQRNVEPVQ